MVVWVVEFSSGGYKIRNIFCLKINIPKGNYLILRIGVVSSCQKLGIILENKGIDDIKKCAPNWYVFFNGKK